MRFKMALLTLLIGLPIFIGAAADSADTPATNAQSVRDLALQVRALQTIHDMELTLPQLLALQAAIPPGLKDENPHADASGATAKYIAALKDLRQALIKNDDDDRIDDLQDDLDDIIDDDDIDVNDAVTVTNAVAVGVPHIISMLSSSQVANYVGNEDDPPDPKNILMDAAAEVRAADPDELDDTVKDTSQEVAILVAGIDPDKFEPVAARVKDWLLHCKSLSKPDFAAAHDDLEKSAAALIRDADAFVIIRHWVERDVSELLANPQLPAILDARLKTGK